MPLVVPSVTRYTLYGSLAGQPYANVFDMSRIIVSGGPMVPADINVATANLITTSFAAAFMSRLSNQLSILGCRWVDMSSLTGDVGDLPAGASIVGGNSAGMPGNVAIRLTKVSGAARGQRPGRVYIGGVGENETSGADINTLNSAGFAAWQADADEFLSAITADVTYDWGTARSDLVTVHTRRPEGGEQVLTGVSVVNQLLVNDRLASQRRRLNL